MASDEEIDLTNKAFAQWFGELHAHLNRDSDVSKASMLRAVGLPRDFYGNCRRSTRRTRYVSLIPFIRLARLYNYPFVLNDYL